MVDLSSFICCRIVRLVDRSRVLLKSHIVLLARQSFRIRVLAVRAHILIILSRLIRIVGLLLESGPALFTDERITILFVLLRIIFEESGRGRRL